MITVVPAFGCDAQSQLLVSHHPDIFRLGASEDRRFPDSSVKSRVLTDLTGQEVLLFGSMEGSNGLSTGEKLVGYGQLADSAVRMGAVKVTIASPWFGFLPQDKPFVDHSTCTYPVIDPLSSLDAIRMLETAPVDEFMLAHVHARVVLDFFTKPLVHLDVLPMYAQYCSEVILQILEEDKTAKFAVAAMDKGSTGINHELAKLIGVSLVQFDKFRDKVTGKVKFNGMKGDVQNVHVFSVDDFTSTAQTQLLASEYLALNGAISCYSFVTHIVSQAAIDAVMSGGFITQLVTTNSTSINKPDSHKVKVLDITRLFADHIAKTVANQPHQLRMF